MTNNIRKILAKIESLSAEKNPVPEIQKALEDKGIKRIRLNQLKGNHRQPNVLELDIIFKVFQKYLPELQLTDLYTTSKVNDFDHDLRQ
jgi:hypothetical protein